MTARDAMRGPAYPIASVDNVLRLLLLFRDRQVLRVWEVSEYLGVVRSTAHRLLAMLHHHDLVRQDPDTRAYVAGPALMEMGLAAMRGLDVRGAGRPVIERLSARLNETSHVVVLVGTNVVFLDSVESRRNLRTGSRAGVSLPAHCTSVGKALLAEMPIEAVAQLYASEQLAALTDSSVNSLRGLERELEQVRQRGFATSFGESETDVAAVGVAVRTPAAAPRTGLAVSGPHSRLTAVALEAVVVALLAAADDLAARLAAIANAPAPPSNGHPRAR